MIGFRNVLIHGYDIVDRDAVWKAVTVEIPARGVRQATDPLAWYATAHSGQTMWTHRRVRVTT